MAWAIEVYILDPDGSIKVQHTFFGETEAEARKYLNHHRESCSYFKSNYDAGNVIEVVDDDCELLCKDDFDDDEDEADDDI